MIKILKKKNILVKIVNNHKTTIYHKLFVKNHRVSKGYDIDYSCLASVYSELDRDFQSIDLIDLKFYERWLDV